MTESKKKSKLHYAWIVLLALCIVRSLSAAGINNTGGLFLKPVADDIGVGVGTLSIYFSMSSIATLIFMPIGGKLLNKYSVKMMVIVSILLQAGSMIALGFMNNVVGWYLLSIPMGIGGAVIVNLAGPILINRWFKKDAGKAMGIMMACAGLFGIVLQPLVANIISASGWRFSYIAVGVAILALVLAATILLIKNNPQEKNLQPFGDVQISKTDNDTQAVATGIPHKTAIKSKSFFGIIIFMITITAFGAFNQHMATYGASLGFEPDKVGMILSISMVGSTLGAIVIGIISDKIGVFKTAIGIVSMVIASLVCLYFGNVSFYIFAAGSFLLGLAAMGIPVLAPLLTKSFFGERDYEIIYSNVMMGPPLATIILLPLYGFIFDLTGSYRFVFILLAGLIAIGAFGLIMGEKTKQKIPQE